MYGVSKGTGKHLLGDKLDDAGIDELVIRKAWTKETVLSIAIPWSLPNMDMMQNFLSREIDQRARTLHQLLSPSPGRSSSYDDTHIRGYRVD